MAAATAKPANRRASFDIWGDLSKAEKRREFNGASYAAPEVRTRRSAPRNPWPTRRKGRPGRLKEGKWRARRRRRGASPAFPPRWRAAPAVRAAMRRKPTASRSARHRGGNAGLAPRRLRRARHFPSFNRPGRPFRRVGHGFLGADRRVLTSGAAYDAPLNSRRFSAFERSPQMSKLARLFAGFAVAAAILGGAAQAHALLLSSKVEGQDVILRYNGRVDAARSRITVLKSDGSEVAKIDC